MKIPIPVLAFTVFAAPLWAQNYNVAYVVDNTLGRVHVLDLANQTVTGFIPTGANSSELYILQGNRTAFVTNQGDGNVAVLDLTNNTRVGTIPAGQGAGSLAATPHGRYLYVANDAANTVTVIDIRARAAVKTIAVGATPIQVNISRSGRFAYVVNQDDAPNGTVSVIDTNRNEVVKTVAVGVRPNQFAIIPRLETAYVVNSGSNDLSLWDLATNEVTGRVPIGQNPATVAFSSDSGRLYIANRGSDDVSVVNTQTNVEIAKIPAGNEPVAMAVTFDSKFAFVSNIGSSSVSLLDLQANAKELDINVGSQPFSLAFDPNEDFLFVTNLGSGTVSVIDVGNDTVAKTIQTGGVPVQFALLNAPTLLEIAPTPAQSGSTITLNGRDFVPGSVVRFATAAPPRTLTPSVDFLGGQGLRTRVPNFQGNAIVDVLNPDGNSSERIEFQHGTAAPSISVGGVVDAGGFGGSSPAISGNCIVSVFGIFSGIGLAEAKALPLPTALDSVRMTFNGVPASLFFASEAAGQINALAPSRLFLNNSVRVAVSIGNQTSAVENVNVAPASPGIFVIPADGMAAAVHGANLTQRITAANPAARDELIVMFVTGLGDTNPPPIDGEGAPFDVLSPTASPVTVEVGGVPSPNVIFAGLTPGFTGLYQINFTVPLSAPVGNDVPLLVRVGENSSAGANQPAKLAVQ